MSSEPQKIKFCPANPDGTRRRAIVAYTIPELPGLCVHRLKFWRKEDQVYDWGVSHIDFTKSFDEIHKHELAKREDKKVIDTKINIKCPHCDHVYTDDDMDNAENDLWAICLREEKVEEVCPNCGELFFIQGSYTPVYETAKTEDELD